MPTPEEILLGLQRIADEWRVIAVFWHLYFALLAAGIAFASLGLTQRGMGILLAMPILSVSILAWATGSPFNGAVFGLVGIALVVISLWLPATAARKSPFWALASGSLLFIFGWIYPHFQESSSFFSYLYSAPTGLIPCPTLSMAVGVLLILSGLSSLAFSVLVGVTGIFYGAFGAFHLGVTIDIVLLLGSLALILFSLLSVRHQLSSTSTE